MVNYIFTKLLINLKKDVFVYRKTERKCLITSMKEVGWNKNNQKIFSFVLKTGFVLLSVKPIANHSLSSLLC